MNWTPLFDAAEAARLCAHAPYSKFFVGAALQLENGTIVSACNVENASYGLTICAERNAIGMMVRAKQKLAAVAIVVDSEIPTPPCGMCRQVLAEFAEPTLIVKSRNLKGQEASWTLGELLPHAFTKKFF
jgi:cytidine deaminase